MNNDCEYCAGGNAKSNRNANPTKNIRVKLGMLLKFGIVLALISFAVFVVCVVCWVLALFGVGNLRELSGHFARGIGISFVVLIVGILAWDFALPKFKVRALVKACGELPNSDLLGSVEIVFETEQGELMTMDVVDAEVYKLISENDVGVLYYKLSGDDTKLFHKFKREGKSVAFIGAVEDKRCESCGATIHIEKYKYCTEIICEYCDSPVK